MVNRVVIVGRMTRDPELRTTTSGKSVVGFSLAVDKSRKPTDGSPTADFFSCTAWGQTAEFVSNYLHKGRLVAVDGRLQSRKYTTNDGQNREVVEIVADSVQALDRAKDDSASAPSGGGYSAKPTAAAATGQASAPADLDEYDPFADE